MPWKKENIFKRMFKELEFYLYPSWEKSFSKELKFFFDYFCRLYFFFYKMLTFIEDEEGQWEEKGLGLE